MRVLIDTNVIVDYLTERLPYSLEADKVFELVTNKKIVGYMAAHSVPNLFFILRKAYSVDTRRQLLKDLLKMVEVIGLHHDMVIQALDNNTFSDFEDCLQDLSAVKKNLDYTITRNTKDFKHSFVPTITPYDFLAMLSDSNL